MYDYTHYTVMIISPGKLNVRQTFHTHTCTQPEDFGQLENLMELWLDSNLLSRLPEVKIKLFIVLHFSFTALN